VQTNPVSSVENRKAPRSRPGLIAYLAWAVLLNAPFVLCHPDWLLVGCPLVRSVVVGLVLFILPGLPWVGILVGRHSVDRVRLLWVVVVSLVALLVVLAAMRLAGWSPCGGAAWNLAWLLMNVGIGVNIAVRGSPSFDIPLRDRFVWLACPLFAGTYLLFYWGAVRVVPPMEDQDFDVLGCGYGLLAQFDPLLVSDHKTLYQFSHPPVAYWCTAGCFLYFDQLDYLKYYYEASLRARNARLSIPFKPFDGTVSGLSKGTGEHLVTGVDGPDYIVAPELSDGSRRVPVWLLENALLATYYEENPRRLPARAANIFLAALTVALMCFWIGRMGGGWTLAVLAPLAYATSPEIFVRSNYGGHFASSNFAVLLLLMAIECRPDGRRRTWWLTCLLAGGFLALVNHKLVLLPAAVVIFELIRSRRDSGRCRLVPALLHPVAVGFAAGTALFVIWGLSIDPAEFWQDHLRTHFFDRIVHYNPLGYGGYPSPAGLWIELARHTGYVLLPMGVGAMLLSLRSGGGPFLSPRSNQPGTSSDATRALWLLWFLLTAIVFSVVDWRQTKHLMPLMLPLSLAPVRWAGAGRVRRIVVGLVFAALLAWNLWTIRALATDFDAFRISPIW